MRVWPGIALAVLMVAGLAIYAWWDRLPSRIPVLPEEIDGVSYYPLNECPRYYMMVVAIDRATDQREYYCDKQPFWKPGP